MVGGQNNGTDNRPLYAKHMAAAARGAEPKNRRGPLRPLCPRDSPNNGRQQRSHRKETHNFLASIHQISTIFKNVRDTSLTATHMKKTYSAVPGDPKSPQAHSHGQGETHSTLSPEVRGSQ